MTRTSNLFYLSLFALWSVPAHCDNTRDACAISPKSIVSDACASYATLERLNRKVGPPLVDLTQTTDFFAYYRLNLFNKECPFWNDANGMCGNIACAVETLDNEEDIPEVWRASELGRLEGPLATHPGKEVQKKEPQKPLRGSLGEDVGESCVVEYDDECDELDYCVPEDESATAKGDYVSLVANPERFTGYAGVGARLVWDAIYRENCFQSSSFPHASSPSSSGGLLGSSGGSSSFPTEKRPAELDFKNMLMSAGRQTPDFAQDSPIDAAASAVGLVGVEDECVEKRVFYRIISGMHTSISTHICREYLNQMTGQWQPNLKCYMERLHNHPDRISNLYFNYALVTRAVAKLGPHLQKGYTFCTGDREQDTETRAKVLEVTYRAASVPTIFDESLMFKNGEGPSLKEDFRNRFRNVSRLMDCVGCDKCRLWGKVQTAGYGAALKVLFELDNNSKEIPRLKRTELVALFNTYARLASSLDSVQKFRVMVEEQETGKTSVVNGENGTVLTDRAKKPHRAVNASPSGSGQQISETEKEDEEDKNWDADGPDIETGDHTLNNAFQSELDNVLGAFKTVMRAYIEFPMILWRFLKQEVIRAWRAYIGLPTKPRQWALQWRGSADEL